ncbi:MULTISPECIES: cupin domain-containing protein [unclassified Pseudofrankia]|uniref:cupin domain-containing protein n=1 Tax=unclassified Pseudofrankia TaxID=2994372 RepID=UPI0018E2D888|nr:MULTISPECIES: cupin domain-containing protein [unclassified Pseudofrankia]MDT3444940.1 cupin domain-containing protein [Pseudofrankia sp. BMG5.37]
MADGPTPVRVATPGFTVCDIWRVETLPTDVLNEDGTTGKVLLDPPQGGFVYRITTFPPDSEWDAVAEYRASLEAMSGAAAVDRAGSNGDVVGLHQTDTVDIVTIISGELYAVTETGETLLKPGDTLVQRGTVHTWSNRGDKPCMKVAVQVGGKR